jgi:DNA gyrase subunit B
MAQRFILNQMQLFLRYTEYNYETLAARMRELSYLNRGISITISDDRNKDENGNHLQKKFFSEGGLSEFVQFLDKTRQPLSFLTNLHGRH